MKKARRRAPGFRLIVQNCESDYLPAVACPLCMDFTPNPSPALVVVVDINGKEAIDRDAVGCNDFFAVTDFLALRWLARVDFDFAAAKVFVDFLAVVDAVLAVRGVV